MKFDKSKLGVKLRILENLIGRVERLNFISYDLMNENSIQIGNTPEEIKEEIKFSCYEMQIIKLHILLSGKNNSISSLLNEINSYRKVIDLDKTTANELIEAYENLKCRNKDILKRMDILRDKLYAHFDNSMYELGNIYLNTIFNSEIKSLIGETREIIEKSRGILN